VSLLKAIIIINTHERDVMQDMAQAKLTRCNHMFHAICLRKWLYMQVQYKIIVG
jgi:hypothetical protein